MEIMSDKLASFASCVRSFSSGFYSQTLPSGEELQLTTTYFFPWIRSYNEKAKFLLMFFRLVGAVLITAFVLVDYMRDREHSYMYSKADYIVWLLEPFNSFYVLTLLWYWTQIKLFFTYSKPDFTVFNGKEEGYEEKQHFETFPKQQASSDLVLLVSSVVPPFSVVYMITFNPCYFVLVMSSILPPFAVSYTVMFFATSNFKSEIMEWQQYILIIVTTVTMTIDHVAFSNYYVNFSHLFYAYGFLLYIYGSCLVFRLGGLVAYPTLDYIANTREATESSLFFVGLYGFFFMVFYAIALLKQGNNNIFKTALWFRKNPEFTEIQNFEELPHVKI